MLLVTGLLFETTAYATDAGLTVLLTTGTGAAIGQSIGGRNGAAIGAATGALNPQAYQVRYRPLPVYAPVVRRPVVVYPRPVYVRHRDWHRELPRNHYRVENRQHHGYGY